MRSSVRALGRHGLNVTPFSFGAAQLGNLYRAISDESARAAVDEAWKLGVRYFDTAPHYGLGLSERRLGSALAERSRDEFLVSTKVGRVLTPARGRPSVRDDQGFDVPTTHVRVLDYSRDGVLRSIEDSLARTGLDRFDIVLVHDVEHHLREALEGAFPTLSTLRAEGVITSFGAGMNRSSELATLIRSTDMDVAMLANRYTLLEQGALDDALEAAASARVSIVAAGVFNSGILATDAAPSSAKYDYADAPRQILERAQLIRTICEAHHVSVPAVAVQFPLAHPAVSTVCLGSRSASQVRRNAELFNESVPPSIWPDLVSSGVIRSDAPTP